MNPGQQKFYEFILSKVEANQIEAAKEMLLGAFEKLNRKEFTQLDQVSFIQKCLSLVKPEAVNEVKAVLSNFKPHE